MILVFYILYFYKLLIISIENNGKGVVSDFSNGKTTHMGMKLGEMMGEVIEVEVYEMLDKIVIVKTIVNL